MHMKVSLPKMLSSYFQGKITSIATLPDKKSIISGAEDKIIKIFDIKAQKFIQQFDSTHTGIFLPLEDPLTIIPKKGAVTALAATSDSRFIISASTDKSIKMFDFNNKQQVHSFENIHEGILHYLKKSQTL